MPANLYGTANPNPLPIGGVTIGSVNVAIPPGVETNFCSMSIPPAVSPGWYYPAVWGVANAVLGASAPTFINWGARIGAGADFATYGTYNPLLIANADITVTLFLYGPTTLISNPFGAFTFNVSANCGVNGFTVTFVGTQMLGQWLRAPDQ